ncbi:FMN-binding glutamate synthase family protein [Thiotrichales bacterium 19S9-12]|nr:FMN-binding glutamate synthase family protein [Thiotrichales bacterium 19S9-11]MCF6810994.1 FMN-binding glutamate synthase family protein [Thiotrichales bacterium 19S9-12]
MRRNWYTGFGIIILLIAALLVINHASIWWFISLMIILGCIAIYDITQTKHSILRNFPILGHIRFILEFFRPEVQQYFIADDKSELPFNRETRDVIYARAKGKNDTIGFGTEFDLNAEGHEWVLHSLNPKHVDEVQEHITVGNKQCTQPYKASRLNISAMSYGALSQNAIIALNKGAKIGQFAHNTGEGGLTKHHLCGGDLIMQLGTGYFGCRKENGSFCEEKFIEKSNLDEVKMIEIKLSQGAKPAHGGVLPKAKITKEIAEIRGVGMDKDVLSPPKHSAFNTPIELCHFLKKLRDLSNGKPVGFKLCIGKRNEFLSICKAILKTKIYPDFITVDGAEGGTGAAPMEYASHVGAPLKDGLIFVHNTLVGFGIRDKIKIICSGKVATGFDMVRYIAMGADMCNAARAMMLSIGCIQSRQCNTNQCPIGVATQNKRLMRALDIDDKKMRVARFHQATINSFLEIIGAMGLKTPSDLDPSMIRRRVDANNIRTYREIYRYLESNSLLDEKTVPEHFKTHWQEASAESF